MKEPLELIWFQHWGEDCRAAGHDPDAIVEYTSSGWPPVEVNNSALQAVFADRLPSKDGYTFTPGLWFEWLAWLAGGPMPPVTPWRGEPIERRTRPPFPPYQAPG